MNFDLELILIIVTLISGGVVLIHRVILGKTTSQERHWLHDSACSLFPILIIVIILRSFLVEPFRIPSGSMLPTLEIGDFILVNKFSYGLRLPVLHYEIMGVGKPKPGDVAVFRFPQNPQQDFIKRIIGVPGDLIEYRDKTFLVNGKRVPRKLVGQYPKSRQDLQVVLENLGDGQYKTLANKRSFASQGGRWIVPQGHYFVSGDNRDNSNDSRSWGFVPYDNLVGKAFFVWFNWRFDKFNIDFSRVGTVIA